MLSILKKIKTSIFHLVLLSIFKWKMLDYWNITNGEINSSILYSWYHIFCWPNLHEMCLACTVIAFLNFLLSIGDDTKITYKAQSYTDNSFAMLTYITKVTPFIYYLILGTYIYIHTYIHTCIGIHIYIYTYIFTYISLNQMCLLTNGNTIHVARMQIVHTCLADTFIIFSKMCLSVTGCTLCYIREWHIGKSTLVWAMTWLVPPGSMPLHNTLLIKYMLPYITMPYLGKTRVFLST